VRTMLADWRWRCWRPLPTVRAPPVVARSVPGSIQPRPPPGSVRLGSAPMRPRCCWKIDPGGTSSPSHADRPARAGSLRSRVALDRGHELEHDQPGLRPNGQARLRSRSERRPTTRFAYGHAWATSNGSGRYLDRTVAKPGDPAVSAVTREGSPPSARSGHGDGVIRIDPRRRRRRASRWGGGVWTAAS
jgi:hypothetical protein